MSKLTNELTSLWLQYEALDQYFLSTRYQSYDEGANEGQGAYYKSAEGFLMWIVDGCPADGREVERNG